MGQALATPVRPENVSSFLRRERQALARRRELLNSEEAVVKLEAEVQTPEAVLECRNATFVSQVEVIEAGFDLDQCETNNECSENDGRNCDSCIEIQEEICEQMEVCEDEDNVVDQQQAGSLSQEVLFYF